MEPQAPSICESDLNKVPESHKQLIWTVCGIFVMALSVRLFYLFESSDNPAFGVPIVDARGYDMIARQLIDEGKMPERFFWQQFFYPCFLSLVYLFSNCSIIIAQVVQACLGAFTCVLTFFLGRAVFNRLTGVVGAAFVALYGPLIFHEMDLVAAGWATFWSIVLILLLLRAADKKQLKIFFLLGLCGALSVVCRPNFLLFFLAGSAWLLFVFYKAHTKWSLASKSFSLALLGFILVALPVAIQNWRITGHFGILPASGGINLYIGNNPNFEAAEIRPGLTWEHLVNMPAQHGVADDMWQKQKFYYEKTQELIISDPTGFLKRLAIKAMQFVCSREMPGGVDIYLFKQWSMLLKLLMWKAGAFGFPFGLLLPLAIIGLICNRRSIPTPIILFVMLYPLSTILTHVETRYRMPMIPVLSILAASGCLWLGQAIAKRKWRPLVIAIFLGVVITLLSSLPVQFGPEKLDYHAELYVHVGTTLKAQGKIEEATENYKKAVRISPEYSEAYHNLGVILYEQGRTADAAEHYKKAIELEPTNYRAHCGLGAALSQLGKPEDAQQHFKKAINIKPDYSLAHKNLGAELIRQGKTEQGISHYEQALQFEPDNADTHKDLGLVLARQNRYDEAIKHFENAIDIRPDFAEVYKALGIAMAVTGRPKEAIEQFRKALKLEPADADTHFFLGLVLAQSGYLEPAVQEFQEALLIDPNHAAARTNMDALLKKSTNSDTK